jgi:sugar lactone lactonase YvrE
MRLAPHAQPPRSALWMIPQAMLICAALLAACAPAPRPQTLVVAEGLDQPRGMALEADGSLLVAEAGAPGATVTPPVTTNRSGRVARIRPDGGREVIVDQLPFTLDTSTGTSVGPTDVAVIGDTLYLLTGEGGDPLSRSVLRITPGEPPQMVASFLAFALKNNRSGEMSGGAGVQANPYAMAVSPEGDALLVSDGASGRVLRVTLDGAITVFAEIKGMPPLTGLDFGPDGRLYFTVFSVLPHTPGTGELWAADTQGALALVAGGLTMPIDVGFDAAGAMYLLEFSDGQAPKKPYAPGRGRLLRIAPDGGRAVVLDGLNFPTSMRFTPTGDLLIATSGAFSEAGAGAIVRVRCADLHAPGACPAP